MNKAFSEKTPELERYNVVSLYILASILNEKYVISEMAEKFGSWFVDFETTRRVDLDKPEDERDTDSVTYQNATSHSTDAVESLEYRHKIVARDFFTKFPEIVPLDKHRGFTVEQKLAIYRRDKGICKLKIKCSGKKMGWDDDWHADHKVPFSKGGLTTVANGQVSCADCNLAKGKEIE